MAAKTTKEKLLNAVESSEARRPIHARRGVILPDEFPIIVCLCGSTRFMDAFQKANLELTMQGKIVLSVGCNTKSDVDLFRDGVDAHPDGWHARVKEDLDVLHKQKIFLADEVLILNVGGYIGDSTKSEIEYATKIGKMIHYLEPIEAGKPVLSLEPNRSDPAPYFD